MFEVAYETTFCSTHRLTRDGRPIEPIHGHDWRVEAVAAGDALDALGIVIDFEELKKAVGAVVARYFFHEIRKGLGAEGRHLRRVRVWEAPGCSAVYAE